MDALEEGVAVLPKVDRPVVPVDEGEPQELLRHQTHLPVRGAGELHDGPGGACLYDVQVELEVRKEPLIGFQIYLGRHMRTVPFHRFGDVDCAVAVVQPEHDLGVVLVLGQSVPQLLYKYKP